MELSKCAVVETSLSMTLLSETPTEMRFKLGTEGGYSNWIGENISFFLDAQGNVSHVMMANSTLCFRTGDL